MHHNTVLFIDIFKGKKSSISFFLLHVCSVSLLMDLRLNRLVQNNVVFADAQIAVFYIPKKLLLMSMKCT